MALILHISRLPVKLPLYVRCPSRRRTSPQSSSAYRPRRPASQPADDSGRSRHRGFATRGEIWAIYPVICRTGRRSTAFCHRLRVFLLTTHLGAMSQSPAANWGLAIWNSNSVGVFRHEKERLIREGHENRYVLIHGDKSTAFGTPKRTRYKRDTCDLASTAVGNENQRPATGTNFSVQHPLLLAMPTRKIPSTPKKVRLSRLLLDHATRRLSSEPQAISQIRVRSRLPLCLTQGANLSRRCRRSGPRGESPDGNRDGH